MTWYLALISANPFQDAGDMLSHDFMRNALLAGTATTLVAGSLSYLVVLRRSAFAGEALSHVAFPAALGSALLGFSPLVGMFVITVGVALGMASTMSGAGSKDVAIGTVLAWVLGFGALLLDIYTSGGSNGSLGLTVLFGSIFGVGLPQALGASAVTVGCMVTLMVILRPLLFATLDPVVASVRGVPVWLLEALFLVLVAIAVSEAVQVVGALLVLSLLVLPGGIARSITTGPMGGILTSICLAVAFTWLGLVLAYYLPYPVSFFISTIGFGAYVTVMIGNNVRTQRRLPTGSRAGPSSPVSGLTRT